MKLNPTVIAFWLNIVVNNGADRVFDLDSDNNQVVGVTITGEPGNAPEQAIAVDGDDNLIEDSTVNGYNERGIAVTWVTEVTTMLFATMSRWN